MPNTEGLPTVVAGSKAEFSRHLGVEKEIKGWLVNGLHWHVQEPEPGVTA